MIKKIAENVFMVGVTDWNIRDFHGYTTERGSSYNAYIVIGKKKVLIDTVKAPFFDEFLSNVKEVVNPEELDYIVLNHMEMDHSSSFPMLRKLAKNAKVVVSERFGEDSFKKTYHMDTELIGVKEGDSLDIGGMKLVFFPTRMLHWPDSMVTYLPERKILFSLDAFGQHYASSNTFDDEVDRCELFQEAKKYFANILMPYAGLIPPTLEKLGKLDIDLIAPGHGIIWRSYIGEILDLYAKWGRAETEKKAVVVYDTMWKSTEKMAFSIAKGIEGEGIPVKIFKLSATDQSDVVAEILDSKGIAIGSPTLNNTLFPTVGMFLYYLKGLRPKNKLGLSFGSYGWGGGGAEEVENVMKEMEINVVDTVKIKFVPTGEELSMCKDAGRNLARKIKES